MVEDKKGFILYADLISVVKKLILKDRANKTNYAGELFYAILLHVNGFDLIDIDFVVELALEPIKLQLERDLEKYKCTKTERSKSGKMGNLKRYHEDLYNDVLANKMNLEDALAIVESRKNSHSDTKLAVTVTDTDTVTEKDTVKVIKKSIEERKTEFKNSLTPFLENYNSNLLNDFYSYWAEHGDRDKKMRFEKQKSFGISRRLASWKKNEKKFNQNPNENLTAEDKLNAALGL